MLVPPSHHAMAFLNELNAPQRAAVLHKAGPLLILAGAGSGKTKVMMARMARLLHEGLAACQILGVTFTNKAASQMRQRLRQLVGRQAAAVNLLTFHALGLQILKQEYAAAALAPNFCIYDSADQLSLLRELLRQQSSVTRRLDARRLLELLLRTKRAGLAEVQLDWGDDYEMTAFELYPRYLAQMRSFNAVDFDDLILRSQAVLQQPAVRARWQTRFAAILVDEYQDTSPDQVQLLQVLAAQTQDICVVGDDDQAIYGWRGAAQDTLLAFARHFPGATEIVLEQNYRSTPAILAVANAVIHANPHRKAKILFTRAAAGEPVQLVACEDDSAEAQYVCDTIVQLCHDASTAPAYRDIAVLYRSNVQSRAFEEVLAQARLPYRVVGGQAFFDRKEVRDALALLALAHNPHDAMALRRIINVPPRGLGTTSVAHLSAFAQAQGLGLWEALQQAASQAGVAGLTPAARQGAARFLQLFQAPAAALRLARGADLAHQADRLFEALQLPEAIRAANDPPQVSARRLENLAQVTQGLRRFAERQAAADGAAGGGPENLLAQFLRASALVREPEPATTELDNITLMTLHSAKGLEFPVVFLVGLEEDLLPHRRAMEATSAALSEERRLCYVGVTRARRQLYLSYAQHRVQHGKKLPRTPSRFLDGLTALPAVKLQPRGVACASTPESAAAAQAHSAQLAADFFRTMRQRLGLSS